MTTFRILDTKAAARLSVDIVVDRKGQHVATIRTLYPVDGASRLHVEVQHTRAGLEHCAKAPHCWAQIDARKHGGHYMETAHELFGLQSGSAGGFGYDKRTAALAGLIVCGHTLANHCGSVPEDEAKRARLLKRYTRDHAKHDRAHWRAAAEKIGASWANWDREAGRYTSLHFRSGLNRLAAFGFTVVSAL